MGHAEQLKGDFLYALARRWKPCRLFLDKFLPDGCFCYNRIAKRIWGDSAKRCGQLLFTTDWCSTHYEIFVRYGRCTGMSIIIAMSAAYPLEQMEDILGYMEKDSCL